MSLDRISPDVFYPESDGRPMAETDVHRREMTALIDMLEWHFRGQEVYVAGNNFLYYEEGNPKAVVSPDVYVVPGSTPKARRIYKLWVEQRAPRFVMELSSKSTWLEDHGNKKALYAMLGVSDYFMFDPEGLALAPPLQGYRLGEDGEYERLEADAEGRLAVASLGLELWIDDERYLHVRDAKTGVEIARSGEIRARHEELAQERDALAQERDALLARLAELEAKR